MAETNEAIDAMFAEKRMQPRTRRASPCTRCAPHKLRLLLAAAGAILSRGAVAPAHASRLAGGEACS